MKKNKYKPITYIILTVIIAAMMVIIANTLMFNNNLQSTVSSAIVTSLEKETTQTLDSLNQYRDNMISGLSAISKQLEDKDLTYIKTNVDRLYKEMLPGEKASINYLYGESLDKLLGSPQITSFNKMIIEGIILNRNYTLYYNNYNSLYVAYAVPIYRDKSAVGILYLYMDGNSFCSLINDKLYPGGGFACIINNQLDMLTTYKGSNLSLPSILQTTGDTNSISLDKFKNNITSGKSSSFSGSYSNQTYYLTSRPLGMSGYSLLNITSKEELPDTQLLTSIDKSRNLFYSILTSIIILLALIIILLIYSGVNLRRERARVALENSRYKSIFSLSSSVIWEYDIKKDTLTKSDPDLGIYTGSAFMNNYTDYITTANVIHPDDFVIFQQFYQSLMNGNQNISCEIRAKDLSQNYTWFELSGTTLYDNFNQPIMIVGQTINIDNKRKELSAIKDSIEKDSLTKLINRKTISRKINSYLASSCEGSTQALVLLDLDHFKSINHTFGYVFGDAFLSEFSSRIFKYFSSDTCLVGRFGGDEFILFFYQVPSNDYLIQQAEMLLSVIYETILNTNSEYNVSGCIGISLAPNHANNFSMLLEMADTALYYAKANGNNSILIYDDSLIPVNYINKDDLDDLPHTNFLSEHSVIDATIVTNTVDILFDARNIEISLNMILGLIGNFYRLRTINIIEYEGDYSHGHISYEWFSNTCKLFNKYEEISMQQLIGLESLIHQNKGAFSTTNREQIQKILSTLSQVFASDAISGLLVCPIYDSGAINGYLLFGYQGEDRIWMQNELDSLALISKIIGGYLTKLRTQEHAQIITKTDPLTGAYNLFAFTDLAHDLISEHPENSYILAYLDIDMFKLINDTYGYSEGDKILIECSNILDYLTEEDELFGRVTADKFVALFKYNDADRFLTKIKYLNKKMNEIPKTESDNYRISIIIGLYPIVDDSPMTVNIDRANMARKSVVSRHKSRFVFFNESMKSSLMKQHEIEDLMEDSLKNNEFVVYYQPKVYLKNNEIYGAEALVRWNLKGKELLYPGSFIPIFEDNHFILKLDFYVFEKVCEHLRSILDKGLNPYPVSINFSRLHLSNGEMIGKLHTIIEKYQIPANLLEIELTESALAANDSFMYTILFKLHQMGFKLSMDDFGSGLSSLNLLRKLPFDIIKLDKDFFQQGSSTDRERIVITNVVKMAKELQMDIVSEGVETEEQADFLRSINCNLAQGYLYAKPMPEQDYLNKYYQE